MRANSRNLSDYDFGRNLREKIWRVQNLYKIIDKNRRDANLKLNRVQTQIVDDILKQKPIRHFSLKTRQQGVSTFWLLWWLDDTIFNTSTQTGILAHKIEALNYLMRIVRHAYNSMPRHLRIPTVGDNKKELEFMSTNSKIFCSLSIRSTGVHNLHISEWCLCRDSEIEATLGAASEDTNISGESTGNGIGNHGYQTYQDSKSGEALDGMISRFFPWFIQDEYKLDLRGMRPPVMKPDEIQLAKVMREHWNMTLTPEQVLWRRYKKKRMKSLFQQEYPATDDEAFLTSGKKFFDFQKLHRLKLEAKEYLEKHPPIEETDKFTVWEEPDRSCVYVAGADTAEGAGDPSVLKIINVTKKREAFLYRARASVPTFYRICDEWGRKYNDALLAVERNNHGHAVILGLDESCEYPNLYVQDEKKKPEKLTHVGTTTRNLSANVLLKIGWDTNQVTRPIMLDHLKYFIEGEEEDDADTFEPMFSIFDVNLLDECLKFEEKDGKYQAMEGETDDDIFATGIAVQMFQRLMRSSVKGVQSNSFFTAGKRSIA